MIAPRPQPSEPETFEDAYRRHYRDVLRYAALMLGDPDDGADIAQEVFVRAFQAWRTGRGPTRRTLPWLLLIARNLIYDRWRRRRRIAWLPLPGSVSSAAADGTARTEFWIWLEQLSQVLPVRQRDALFLRYAGDLSDAEIGEVLGLSSSGVRSLLSRAVATLRKHPELER